MVALVHVTDCSSGPLQRKKFTVVNLNSYETKFPEMYGVS